MAPIEQYEIESERAAFIYAYADETGVRYVGRSVHPEQRHNEHLRGEGGARTYALDLPAMRRLIIEATTESSAQERETFWICALREKHPLVNMQSPWYFDASKRPNRGGTTLHLRIGVEARARIAAIAAERSKDGARATPHSIALEAIRELIDQREPVDDGEPPVIGEAEFLEWWNR